MSRRSIRCVQIVILSIFAFGASAQAQEPPAPETELKLEEVVVTATRLADSIQELRRVPGQVYVVTAEDIQREKPRNVPEAIGRVPGIVVYDQVGSPFQPTVDLRGFNAQPNTGIAVFVDGVRVNEPDSNGVNWDLIPIQDVERIEVLPGATAVFGQNAIGGVINIVTKRGGRAPQSTLEAAGGSFNHYRVTANTSGPVGDLDYYGSFRLDRESGFRDDSDGRLTQATGRVGYRPSQATDLSVSYSYVNDHLEQAGTLPLPVLEQNREANISPVDFYANELSTFTFQGRQKLPWGFSLAGNAFYRQTSRELQTVGLTSVARAITDTDGTGGALQLSHEAKVWDRLNRFVIGGEIQASEVDSGTNGSFLGFPFTSQSLIDQDVYGFFAQDTFDLFPELVLTAAVRYDSTRLDFVDEITPPNSGSKSFSRWTPRAGLTYTPLSVLTVYFNYGEGFRTPTTDELFAFGVEFSNPDLRPVKSRTYEVGLRARPLQWLETTLAFFLTDVQDEIVFDPTVPPFGRNVNGPESRRQGVEAGVNLRPHETVDILLNYTFTDARFTTQESLSTGLVEDGDRVPLVPRHRVNGTVTYRPLPGLELSLNGQYVSRQVLLNDEPNLNAFRVQDYFVLNARAAYTWKHFTWFIQGNNLTDSEYETFGVLNLGRVFLMPAAGINVLGGITIRFENYY
ncbi:MAG: TonB-dependent receptor [Candidatus Methylomirabilota bacterium]